LGKEMGKENFRIFSPTKSNSSTKICGTRAKKSAGATDREGMRVALNIPSQGV
jgi:hypothetical protein